MDFANRLYAAPDVVTSPRFVKPKLDPTGFTIQHYAGGVQVTPGGSLAKSLGGCRVAG